MGRIHADWERFWRIGKNWEGSGRIGKNWGRFGRNWGRWGRFRIGESLRELKRFWYDRQEHWER